VTTVRIALAAAALWAAGLVVAALTLPAYTASSSTAQAGGEVHTTSSTATFAEANGTWGLVVASLPLASCLVVAVLLLGPGGRATQLAAAALVALLGALTVLSLLSIGIFIAPVTVGLAVAVISALTASGAPPREATP
jgi:hypothetical protein